MKLGSLIKLGNLWVRRHHAPIRSLDSENGDREQGQEPRYREGQGKRKDEWVKKVCKEIREKR